VTRQGEWFLPGTQARAGSAAAAGDAQAFGIQTPRDGSVVLLDPDIPPQAQRLAFVGAPGQWRLNGRLVGSGSVVHWLPRPGRHVLERRTGAGAAEVVDRVAFEVRAASPPPRRAPGG
jgi:penicillin-binding protein 1C